MYLVFKTTYIDREKPLRDGAFSFTRRRLFPPLDKRNTRDKAKGKAYHFGEVYRGSGLSYTISPWDLPRSGSSAVAHSSTAGGGERTI